MRTRELEIRRIGPEHIEFVRSECKRHWVSPVIWSRGREFHADELAGFVGLLSGRPAGQVTYSLEHPECEVVTLSSSAENHGVGSALLDAAVREAQAAGCRRAFLTTSNDNLRALGFYQRRGWRLVRVHPGMIDSYRQREKAIPEIGLHGIPLHDEVELELPLTGI